MNSLCPSTGIEKRRSRFIPAKFTLSPQKPRFPGLWTLHAPQTVSDEQVYHMTRVLSSRIPNIFVRNFGFVVMKRRIQERIYEETKRMGPEELAAYFRRRVREGPFAELWHLGTRKTAEPAPKR